jgi:hypothetical protein
MSSLFGKESLATSLFASTSQAYTCNHDLFSKMEPQRRQRMVWTKAVGSAPVKIDPDYHDALVRGAGGHLILDSTSPTTNSTTVFSGVDKVLDETMGVLNVDDFLRVYNIKNGNGVPAVHPSSGKVYRVDRLRNGMGGLGKEFLPLNSFFKGFVCINEDVG